MAKTWREIFSFKDIVKKLFDMGALALIFFIASDFVFKTPELTGRWEFTTYPEFAKSKTLEVLQISFTVLLFQEGLKVKGIGEKIGAYIPPNNKNNKAELRETYAPGQAARIRIEFEGYIEKNYLSNDKLVLRYNEAGTRRESSTVQMLTIEDSDFLSGIYKSTISDSEGKIKWKRIPDQFSR